MAPKQPCGGGNSLSEPRKSGSDRNRGPCPAPDLAACSRDGALLATLANGRDAVAFVIVRRAGPVHPVLLWPEFAPGGDCPQSSASDRDLFSRARGS